MTTVATWPTRALTDREMQVLTRVANGKPNADIARELFLAEETIKTYMRRIFDLLGARDRAQAATIALASGILPISTIQIPGTIQRAEREQQLLTLLLHSLGQGVRIRLIDGQIITCEIAAIMPGDTVAVYAAPLRTPRRYRFAEIASISRPVAVAA